MSLADYIEQCKDDPSLYASPYQRMLNGFGTPEIIDTRKDSRLMALFGGKQIKRYPAFKNFFGMEDTVESIVKYFTHAAQGLEESKQVLYLLGPVGSAKSSLAETLKSVMQDQPFYAVSAGGVLSPVKDHPLAMVLATAPRGSKEQNEIAAHLQDMGVPHYLVERLKMTAISPWLYKRMSEVGGDLSQFEVRKLFPNDKQAVAIAKVEPGDENNQDITALVGKVDIRMLEQFPQDDPDAYSFSGGLSVANRGLLEFVEMFKAPIKMLHPLLTATQEGNYKGVDGGSAIPFDGIIMAHSNESEWLSFYNNKNNEAFLDRVYTIKAPYNLRIDEEVEIYKKLFDNSALKDAPRAPGTFEVAAGLAVASRLKEPETSSIHDKARVYNGERLSADDVKASSLKDYKDAAKSGDLEGMSGLSTRFMFKALAEAFNQYSSTPEATPVSVLMALESVIDKGDLAEEKKEVYLGYLKEHFLQKVYDDMDKAVRTAFLESNEYGQNVFDRYVTYADFWVQGNDYRDPNTNQVLDRNALDSELREIEKPAGVSNPKDFRNEVVNYVLRYRAENKGQNPSWTSYNKLRAVIEKKVVGDMDAMLPVISFDVKADEDQTKKHNTFVANMKKAGWPEASLRRDCEWYLRVKKSM